MSEKGKKRPAWLTGIEEEEQTALPLSRRNQGPLAEPAADEQDTGEIDTPAEEGRNAAGARQTATIPRVQASGASNVGDESSGTDQSRAGTAQQSAGFVASIRENPGPLVLALMVLIFLAVAAYIISGWIGGGADETSTSDQKQQESAIGAGRSPQTGGADDTGIIFSGLDTSGDKATLQGAGLDWEGSVAPKDDGSGETITLEGPTAAQVERGFEVDNSDIDSGVYALAQDDGSVLHVATHTYQLVAQQRDKEAGEEIEREITLGTIFDLEGGNLRRSGFYIDRHEPGSPKTLRTYYSGPDFDQESSYDVSFNAPSGTPVPLLVGYREEAQRNRDTEQGEE